ncbi:hypothetical protein [Antarctobacter heliothermus]|uniref:Uncharacterized protein n=1 Tax=Antarctobacter heliothermus TaxID=74033 RepID=A0A239CLL9_9RHOB|nr:hypothetical protein [Antarctobacter heliothermus]SNS20233.1 hypothetical protein SAMN04488078_100726 [Antarctobacter heliothermus]
MTQPRPLAQTLRTTLGAFLIAATAATAILPGAAAAKSSREFGLRLAQSERISEQTETRKDKKPYVTQCAYISKKRAKYAPKHVTVKKYRKVVNCKKLFKNKVILRQFKMDQTEAQIKANVAAQANRL